MYSIPQLADFMIKHDSSDLYLNVGRAPSFKINGEIVPAGEEMITSKLIHSFYSELLSKEQQEEFEAEKEFNTAFEFPKVSGRFRFNFYWQKNSPAIVVRKIETEIKTLAELKLPTILNDVVMAKRGLILVVGATGSGKSTSLAAMIDHRNRNEAGHIITIEDPVEFVHQHQKCVISQREVGVDTLSFKAALKNTLRQAPTVILLGEIRDEETMEYAMNFAETGHLCLATLHSNNADQAMERVINFFPAERHAQIYMQLSLNLNAIVSQRLVKTVEGGRAAAVEILLSSGRIRDLIKKGEIESLKETMTASSNVGMQTFDQALIALYQDGRISLEEAMTNADSATDMKIKLTLQNAK